MVVPEIAQIVGTALIKKRRMEMSPIVARHDRNVSSQKGGMQRVDANGRLFLVDLDEAEHRAEEIALANLPLVAGINIGAVELARINAKPHSMGPPLNLSSTVPFVDSPPIAVLPRGRAISIRAF
jgi:hypothetical protein